MTTRERTRIRVRLIGVAEPQRYPETAPAILRAPLRAAVAVAESDRRKTLAAAIDTAAETLRDRVAAVEKVVATGVPSEVIVRDAKTHASDLIVMGARGLGTVKRLLLGSVSESVLRHAECPVLIVHRQTFDWRGRP
jgi:nucleotide-binding universal stress UspA family protein